MSIDAQIPLQIRKPNFATPADAMSLKEMVIRAHKGQLELEEQKRQQQDSMSLRDIFRQPGMIDENGAPTPQGLKGVYGIDPMTGMKMQQAVNQQNMLMSQLRSHGIQDEANRGQIDDRKRAKLEKAHTNQTNAYVSAYDLATQKGAPPELANQAANAAWEAQLAQDKSNGLMEGISPEMEEQVRQKPKDITQMRAMVTPPKEVAAQIEKKEDNARQQRSVDIAERRAIALEKRPEPVSTVQVADPKDPDKAIVIDARTGKKIGDAPPPKATAEKALPVSAAQKLNENQQNLRKAEKALELIEGKGDPNATGLKGYLPDVALQRLDPEGVDTRAAIADLGSMIIHDRSGAAVTASEFPRLKPFIPTVTDDQATVKKKLKNFVATYKEIVNDSAEFYRESGYRVPEFKSSEPTSAPEVTAPIPVSKTTIRQEGKDWIEYYNGKPVYKWKSKDAYERFRKSSSGE